MIFNPQMELCFRLRIRKYEYVLYIIVLILRKINVNEIECKVVYLRKRFLKMISVNKYLLVEALAAILLKLINYRFSQPINCVFNIKNKIKINFFMCNKSFIAGSLPKKTFLPKKFDG